MGKSFLFILLAVVVSFLLVRFGFHDPKIEDPREEINFARLVDRPYLAMDGYQKLVQTDSLNIWYHYERIISQYAIPGSRSGGDYIYRNDIKSQLYYQRLADNPLIEFQDRGNFGLAVIAFEEGNYEEAENFLNLISDTGMIIRNYLLGEIAWRDGHWNLAEKYYKKEIALKGDTAEAWNSLGWMYYYDQRWDKFGQLASNKNSKHFLPEHPSEEYFFSTAQVIPYMEVVLRTLYEDVNPLTVAAALLLAFVWIGYLRRLDIFEPEKWKHILLVLLAGACSALMVFPITDAGLYLMHIPLVNQIHDSFLYCVVGIGMVEELVKIIPFLLIMRFSRIVNEPVDYIIFASLSALGFSFAENISYFKSVQLDTILIRGLLSTTLHMFTSSLIAYAIVISQYRKTVNIVAAFVLFFAFAAIIHGLFDYSIFHGAGLYTILYIGLPCVALWSTMINSSLNQSGFYRKDQSIDADKMQSFLHYAFAGVLIIVFIAEGWWFGPSVAIRNVSAGSILGMVMLLFISLRLSYFDIIPGYWLPLQYRVILARMPNSDPVQLKLTIFKGGYDIVGKRLRIEPFRSNSILQDYPAVSGTIIQRLSTREIIHVLQLHEPFVMDGKSYNKALLSAKDEDDPVGLMANVVCYFFLVPEDVNLESENLTRNDFEFIDWATVNPMEA